MASLEKLRLLLEGEPEKDARINPATKVSSTRSLWELTNPAASLQEQVEAPPVEEGLIPYSYDAFLRQYEIWRNNNMPTVSNNDYSRQELTPYARAALEKKRGKVKRGMLLGVPLNGDMELPGDIPKEEEELMRKFLANAWYGQYDYKMFKTHIGDMSQQLDELEKLNRQKMKEVREEYKKTHGYDADMDARLRFMPPQAGGTSYMITAEKQLEPLRVLEREAKELKAARDILKAYREAKDEGVLKQFAGEFGRGFKDMVTDILSFGMADLGSEMDLKKVIDKSNRNGYDSLSTDEKRLLQANSLNRAMKEFFSPYRGMAQNVAETVEHSIPYMVSFGTLGKVGTAAAKGITRAAAAATKAMPKVALNMADFGTRAMVISLLDPRTAKNGMENINGDAGYEYNRETGKIEYTGRENTMSFPKAMAHGLEVSLIENLSEFTGYGFEKMWKNMALSLPELRKAMTNVQFINKTNDTLKKFGFNGTINEFLEEEVATFLHSAAGDGEGQWEDFIDADRQLTTLLGVAIPGLGMSAAASTASSVQRYNIKSNYEKAAGNVDRTFGKDSDVARSLEQLVSEGSAGDINAAIADYLYRNDLSREQKAAAVEYLVRASAYSNMDKGFEERKAEEAGKVTEAINSQINGSTGSLITGRISGVEEPATIYSKIVLNEDGTINRDLSDRQLVYSVDGVERKVTSIERLERIEENIPAEDAIRQGTEEATAPVEAERANGEVRRYDVGEDVRVSTDGGKTSFTGKIAGVDGKGNYTVDVETPGGKFRMEVEPRHIINEDNLKGVDNGMLVEYENGQGQIVQGEVTDLYSLRSQGLAVIGQDTVPISSIKGLARSEEARIIAEESVQGQLNPKYANLQDEYLSARAAYIDTALTVGTVSTEKRAELEAEKQSLQEEIAVREGIKQRMANTATGLNPQEQQAVQSQQQIQAQPIQPPQPLSEIDMIREAAPRQKNGEVDYEALLEQNPESFAKLYESEEGRDQTVKQLQAVSENIAKATGTERKKLEKVTSINEYKGIKNKIRQLEEHKGRVDAVIRKLSGTEPPVSQPFPAQRYMNEGILPGEHVPERSSTDLTAATNPDPGVQMDYNISHGQDGGMLYDNSIPDTEGIALSGNKGVKRRERKRKKKETKFQKRIAVFNRDELDTRGKILYDIATEVKYLWSDLTNGSGAVTSKGLANSLFGGNGSRNLIKEKNSYFNILDNNGVTPEEHAHDIWEENPDRLDSIDILNEVLDVLSRVRSRGEALNMLEKEHVEKDAQTVDEGHITDTVEVNAGEGKAAADEMPFAMPDKDEVVPFQRTVEAGNENLERVNEKFNEELQGLTADNADSKVLYLGTPSVELQSAGIESKPFKLYGSKLLKKTKKHGFEFTDIKDLPKAIAHPIAVFKGSERDSHAILTEIQIDGNNVLVAVNVGKNRDIDFNIISSTYGKSGKGVIGWINNGKLLYSDKEKTLNYLGSPALIAGAVNNSELDSATKIVEEFENPSIQEQKSSDSFKPIGRKAFDQLVNVLKKTGLARNVITDRAEMQEYLEKILGKDSADRFMMVWHGGLSQIEKFSYDHVARSGGRNKHGVGIYFGTTRVIGMAYAYSPEGGGFLHLARIDEAAHIPFTGEEVSEKDLRSVLENLPEVMRERVVEQMGKSPTYSSLYSSISNAYDEVEAVSGETMAERISKGLKIRNEKMDFASRVFARSGIDGYIQDRGAKGDFVVVFNDGVLSVEGVEEIREMRTRSGEVYGFVTPQGDVYIDPEKANANTPIHEFGHLWNDYIKDVNPDLYRRGSELIKSSPYWEKVNNNPAYARLSEEGKINEALAMAIGDKGELMMQSGDILGFSRLRAFINNLWEEIKKAMGFGRRLDIENMTLEEFAGNAVRELTRGKALSFSRSHENDTERRQSEIQYADASKYDFDVSGITEENAQEMQDIKDKGVENGTFMKAPNGKRSNLNERQWLQVRTEAFKKWFGEWESSAKYDIIFEGMPVSNLTGNEFAKDENGEPLVNRVTQFYKEKYDGQIERDNFGVVELGHREVQDSYYHGINRSKSIAFAAVPDIIQKGILISETENHKGRGYDTYTFAAPVNIGSDRHIGFVTVTRKGETNRFYLHGVVLQKNLRNGFETGQAGSPLGDIAKILQNFYEANKNSSRVVDENGEPLVVYHGTSNEFTVFGERKGDSQGTYLKNRNGFFFANRKEAELYGNGILMPAFINLRNPNMVDVQHNLSELEYDYKTERDEAEEAGYPIARWLGEGEAEFEANDSATAYLDDNMDEIIEDTENNDNDGVFVIGADGSRTVISFAPSQIKSAANNNGNFDNNSDDIRFQFIGEKGAAALDKAEEATMRLDNLAVAREMEKTFGDKQTKEQRQKIKLATGWERGADGKWRYEMPDIEINDNIREIGKGDISALPLDDVISGKELFKAYPQLKGIMVDIDDDMPASASFDGNTISLQELTILGSYNNLKKSIIHELQHAIQDIEGFAQGGRWTKETVSERIKAGYEIAEFIEDKAKESNIPIRKVGEKIRQMDLFYGLYKEVFDHLINNPYFEENIKDLAKQAKEPTGYERYRRLAGETEARNAEHRMNMPAAERRASLVEETEDVAREDQIIIYKSLDKSHSGKDFKGETERIKSEIARAEQETDTNPTEGQKKAGNYRKGHVRIQGFDISIEQPKGSVRRGVDENGKAWESKMYNTYGYFGKTESRDGDHIDVFLGENPLSKKVFVVDQVNPETGKFDEHKVMFGFDGIDEARKAYMSNYEKGWKGLGSITETDVETFRSWANKDGARVKAFSQYRDISANVEEKKKRIEKLRNSKPVEISGEEYKGKYELNPKSAKEYIKNNLRGTYTNKDTGETIDVSRVGMDKVTSHGEKDEAHLKSIAAIPQLIEDSIFIDELQNEKGNDKYDSYRYYVSGLKIGSEDYTAKIVVGVKEGKKYYDHELTSIEKGKLIDDLNLIAKQVANQSVSYSGIKDTKLLSILQNESPQGKESPDDNIRFQVRTAGTAAESEEKKKLLEAARADLNKRLSGGARLREIYQDRYIPVKHFIDTLKEFGTVVEDYDNWYLSATHLDGKVDAQLDAYNKKFQRPLNEAVNDFLKEGATKREVENYAMLKHGLERNKRMREEALKEFMNENPNATQAEIAEYELRLPKDYSGVTAIEAETGKTAKNNISEFEAKYGQKLIDRFWKRVNEATDFSLGTLYKGGLMDKDTYENIKNRDRYYVPLRGHDATTAEDMYNYYQDMGQYFSDPVKTAKGRRSRAELPLEYIYQMAHSSILSAVRNTQNQKMLRLAWKDRTGLIRANETWYINGIAQVPEYDADPDVYAENVRKFDEDMVYAEKNGLAGRAKSRLNIGGMFIKYPQAQQHTIQVTQNGKDYTVYINANPSVAQAVTGLNTYRKEYNPESEKLKNKKGEETTFSKVIHATLGNYPEMLRFIAANLTSRNPMFVLSNAIRDYGYTAFSSSVKEGVKYSARLQGNIPDAIGALTRFAAGKGNLNKKQDRYLVDYIMQGGKTGFSHLVNIDRIQKEVERDIKNGNHKNVIRTILDFMQHTNDVAENACRLATFITSREAGRSMEQSIADAKDITVNFNRKGAGGTGKILGPIANFLRWHYMFTNVAIQALQNAGKMIRENPKRATGAIMVSSGMFALPYLMTAALGGEDEYFRLSEYDRKNNMCFYVPGGGFVKIPVAQELRVLNGLVQDVILNFAGKKGVEETALGVATSLSDLLPLNPLGSAIESFEDPRNLGAFTPDRWKPLVETFLTNRDFTGASITKDFPGIEKKPGYMQAKVNKKGEPYAPEWLMFTTEWLNTATGGNNRERGVISLNPDKVNHLANGYMGALFQIPSQLMDMVIKGFDPDEDVKIRDTQLKRFFSSTDELPALDRYDERDYRKIEAALKEAKSEKDYLDKAVNNHLIGIDEYAKGYEKLGDMVMFINHIMPLIKAKNGEEPGIKDLEDDLKYMSKDEQRAAEAVIAEKKKKVVEVFNKLREKE